MDIIISKPSECFFCLIISAFDHEPAWRLGEEEDHDSWMVGETKKMERGIWYERFLRMVWVSKSTLAPTI